MNEAQLIYNQLLSLSTAGLTDFRQIKKIIEDWYRDDGDGIGGHLRDRLLLIDFDKRSKKLPAGTEWLYRGLVLKGSLINKALLQFPQRGIKLSAKHQTSSWTTDRVQAKIFGGTIPNEIGLVYRKSVSSVKSNILLYSPSLIFQFKDLKKNVGLTNVLKGEKEVILTNNEYILNIKPDDIVWIDGMDLKKFTAKYRDSNYTGPKDWAEMRERKRNGQETSTSGSSKSDNSSTEASE